MAAPFVRLLDAFLVREQVRKRKHLNTYFYKFVGWARQHGLDQLWLSTKGRNTDTFPGITSLLPGSWLIRLAV